MNNLQQVLEENVIKAIESLYGASVGKSDISFQETRKEFEGDITLVAFAFTKISRKSPEETGKDIGNYLLENAPEVSGFNVLKGFLNIVISDAFWVRFFREENKPGFGIMPQRGEQVMVEYSSPNTNKPLHLGHVRNILLGYSLAEILKANGYTVIKANLINDRGIHICKSMLAWQKWDNGETPASSGLKGDHLVGNYYVLFDKHYKKEVEELVNSRGITEEEAKKEAPLIKAAQDMLLKWENNDPGTVQLWKMMNGWVYDGFDVTYATMGVDFDKFYYESETYLLGKEIVEDGLQKGVFYKKPDGSVWIDLTAEGLDHKLVLRADGTSVYITQDLGTAQLRFDEYNIGNLVYVVGNEQEYHFKVLKLILEKMGRPWAGGIYHLSYGMVDLPSGKMKSREGTVVDADELIGEMISTAKSTTEELGKTVDFSPEQAADLYRKIGLAALKYFILKVDPRKRMLFNPEESIDFNGNTGPFLQYTYARIQSLLRKAGGAKKELKEIQKLEPKEKELLKVLFKFPEAVREAGEQYSPSVLANYAYELARAFNQFYHELSILGEDPDVSDFRVSLSGFVAQVLNQSVTLLGMEMPEKM